MAINYKVHVYILHASLIQPLLLVTFVHGVLRVGQNGLQGLSQPHGRRFVGEIAFGGLLASWAVDMHILARGLIFAIDEDRSYAILDSFLVGRIA